MNRTKTKNKMSQTTKQNDAYEFLNSKQKEIFSTIEKLLIGLTVFEAKELFNALRITIEETKIV